MTFVEDFCSLVSATKIEHDFLEVRPIARNDSASIRVSKFLSKVLRHAAHEYGLELQPGGWVNVEELIQVLMKNGFRIDWEELEEVVANNDKQRFSFDESGKRIRANQGHSMEVDLQLMPTIPPETLFTERSQGFSIRSGKRVCQKEIVIMCIFLST